MAIQQTSRLSRDGTAATRNLSLDARARMGTAIIEAEEATFNLADASTVPFDTFLDLHVRVLRPDSTKWR